MADFERYWSLFNRQVARVEYARELIPIFHECRHDLGPNPSYNAVVRWLNDREIKPSAKAKPNASWVPQILKDYLRMDGIEPDEDAIRECLDAMRTDRKNQTARQTFLRELGMRTVIVANWRLVMHNMAQEKGAERYAFEERRLDRHLKDIETVAQALREALLIMPK